MMAHGPWSLMDLGFGWILQGFLGRCPRWLSIFHAFGGACCLGRSQSQWPYLQKLGSTSVQLERDVWFIGYSD